MAEGQPPVKVCLSLDDCPVEESLYQYQPSLAANAVLLAIFAVSGLVHLYQLIRWRARSFSIPILIGCFVEIIGYVGRILLSNNPFDDNGFLIQICCLTFGPAFFSAAIYFCIADIVQHFGEETSFLKPKQYAWIFIPCDLVSLILQGTGGGLASVASQNEEDDAPGTNTMIAGLVFQVVTLMVFNVLIAIYAWRTSRARSSKAVMDTPEKDGSMSNSRLALFAIPFSLAILTIFTRCVYRVAELSEGWEGDLIHDEASFIALEGVMIAIAAIALNIGHPMLLNKK